MASYSVVRYDASPVAEFALDRDRKGDFAAIMNERITIQTGCQGLHAITDRVHEVVKKASVSDGLCTLLIQHTSASLTIQENADPSAKSDLEAWLNRLVAENDPLYTHTAEGPDDMPSHIKAALTSTTLSIPIVDSRLALGRWQGIFIWEHRCKPGIRNVIIHVN